MVIDEFYWLLFLFFDLQLKIFSVFRAANYKLVLNKNANNIFLDLEFSIFGILKTIKSKNYATELMVVPNWFFDNFASII